jgi:hypothetical protein
MSMKYFSYSPDDGFHAHETAEQAKAAAESALQLYRDEADGDGWDESVTEVCWGEVLQRAKETDRREVEDGSTFDYYCDYTMEAM